MTNEMTVFEDRAIMPTTFEGMMTQAEVLVKSGLLPAEIKTAPTAMAIMLTGRELGIPPMQAFRSVYVVKGKPTLSAQLMGALILRAGHTYRVVESTDERCVIEFQRRGQGHSYRHEFTMDDAKTAQLAGNATWKQYPKAMLFSRCMSAGARVAMPDVLAGMYTPEELADDGQVVLDDGGEVIDVMPTRAEQRDNAPPKMTRPNRSIYKSEPPKPQIEAALPPAGHWIEDDATRRAFWAWTTEISLSHDDVHEALGVESIKDFTGTKHDAKARIDAWINMQAQAAAYAEAEDETEPEAQTAAESAN